MIPLADCFTGFYAGFAIFTMLGHMYLSKCVDSFESVASPGLEFAFIVYPDGLSITGAAAPFYSVLFFFMMMTLGFGTGVNIKTKILVFFV